MMQYGVDDVRAFAGNDLRFLRQFAQRGCDASLRLEGIDPHESSHCVGSPIRRSRSSRRKISPTG